MADNPQEVPVPVYGLFESRPAGEPKAEWQRAAETPGPLAIRPGEVYRFSFFGIPDVRDSDLERLLDSLRDVRAFKWLNIQGCRITDRAFQRVVELPWLEAITSSTVTDRGLTIVAKLVELRQLNLEGSPISDRGLANLAGLTHLKDVSLGVCPITDRGLEYLAGLAELEEIGLGGCPAITDRGVAILAALPRLHVIGLADCWRITDRGIGRLAEMPQLTRLLLCRGGSFLERLLRKLGVCRNTEVGAFSQAAVQRLLDAHPNCDLWQPIDWSKVS